MSVPPSLLPIVRKHGWNATSFQTLEPGFRRWFAGDDACVAYADTGAAWVAAGAPLAAPERFQELATAFVEAARAAGRRACFFATERRFVERTSLGAMQIGEQPIWDPRAWSATLRSVPSLRTQLRRARAKGVVVEEVPAAAIGDRASALRPAIDRLAARWLATRGLPPMGFLVDPQGLTASDEARGFVARQDDRLVGFAIALPIFARRGWLMQHLVRDPEAPNGTAELLVDRLMRDAAADGADLATMGLAPLSGDVHPWLRLARGLGGRLFDFDGLRAFKAKLRPWRWDPIYVSYPLSPSSPLASRAQLAVRGALAIHDALAAFARGGFLRFGLETLRLRGARAACLPHRPRPDTRPALSAAS